MRFATLSRRGMTGARDGSASTQRLANVCREEQVLVVGALDQRVVVRRARPLLAHARERVARRAEERVLEVLLDLEPAADPAVAGVCSPSWCSASTRATSGANQSSSSVGMTSAPTGMSSHSATVAPSTRARLAAGDLAHLVAEDAERHRERAVPEVDERDVVGRAAARGRPPRRPSRPCAASRCRSSCCRHGRIEGLRGSCARPRGVGAARAAGRHPSAARRRCGRAADRCAASGRWPTRS